VPRNTVTQTQIPFFFTSPLLSFFYTRFSGVQRSSPSLAWPLPHGALVCFILLLGTPSFALGLGVRPYPLTTENVIPPFAISTDMKGDYDRTQHHPNHFTSQPPAHWEKPISSEKVSTTTRPLWTSGTVLCSCHQSGGLPVCASCQSSPKLILTMWGHRQHRGMSLRFPFDTLCF